ncbi:MAG TPA: hypothetical protein VIY48_09550, partial [Candidatus Paceibacterota bacterium]
PSLRGLGTDLEKQSTRTRCMRADEVSVVAGGWSVKAVDLTKIPGMIIGINEAALLLPRCDVCVSMDRLWTEARWKQLCERKMMTYLRPAAVINIPDTNRDWCNIFQCDHTTSEFSLEPGILNGTNSGQCGFNLAYQIRPTAIYLFGFDMRKGPGGEAHWYDPYTWVKKGGGTTEGKFREWSKQFKRAAEQCAEAGIAVFNCSTRSAINAFPKTAFYEKRKV